MEASGNPLITSAPRSGGDVLHTPDPRRWWALALLCGAFFMVLEGFQSALLALVVLAGIGMALALLLLGRPRKAPQERLEAVPVPIQSDQGADGATRHGAVQGQGRSGGDERTGGRV